MFLDMNPPDHNSVVAKANEIIEKMARFDLSELRLIAYCIAHYDSRNPENRTFKAYVKDLAELFPMDEKSAYAVVQKTMDGISQKPLKVKEGKRLRTCQWFSAFDYIEGEGSFEFHIGPEARPYLLGLKDTFTRYRLGDVYQFRSAITWKLYERLKQWEAKGRWNVELDALREDLGVGGKYPRWDSLSQWVVEPATKEINELSDLSVSYEKERRGRKISALTFIIKSKPPEGTIDVETPEKGLFQALLGCGLPEIKAVQFAQDAEARGKARHLLERLPSVRARWQERGKGPLQAYVVGFMKDELYQMRLFEEETTRKANKAKAKENNKLAKEAIACIKARGGQCDAPEDSEKCRACGVLHADR